MAAEPMIPSMMGGRRRWWVWHVKEKCKCDYAWFAGPFESKERAEQFRDRKLLDETSCPGCGQTTPDANDYSVGQM